VIPKTPENLKKKIRKKEEGPAIPVEYLDNV
jgi:hypothetical protein